MNTPHLYYVPELVEHSNTAHTQHPEAGWIPLRPMGFQGLALGRRLKLAWGIFTGKYDAVYWEPTLRDVCRHTKVNIFTEIAASSKINAATSATPAMTFREPPGEDQVADEAAVMAAIAAGTQMYNQ